MPKSFPSLSNMPTYKYEVAGAMSGPVTCCRDRDKSADTDARLTRMGDPANHSSSGYASAVEFDGPPAVLRVTLDPGAKLPTRAHEADAGLDLFALSDQPIHVIPGTPLKVPTGVHVAVPPGYLGKIEGRSGFASLGVIPTGGIIDQGYTGDVTVNLVNLGKNHISINPDRAIAQLVLYKIATPAVMAMGNLNETARGDKGFGSSDKPEKGV